MSVWVDVARMEAISTGKPVHVEIDGAGIAVFKLEDGFYAIEDVCTHDGGVLTGGCVENDQIICPRHGARFNIRTGAVTAPPAYEAVYSFPVRVMAGRVQVKDDRWD